ncbi:ATP-dependent DNA helicase [Enterococcus canis]|uniref:ATP-dependent DNA helicase n=1 Tax=Enterococcus canis TaxID=214095 RepID=UPI00082C4B6D|nr:ATP-dependent DNA helicase [Enterococcus canis]
MKTNRVSVKQLVEFVLRKGSIDQRHRSEHTALEGARIHRKLQKEAGAGYQKEVKLAKTVQLNGKELILEGRADGIITEAEGIVIDEIKTSEPAFEDLLPEQVDLFWYQAMVYGHLYAEAEGLSDITIQLTYFQTTEEKITRQRRHYQAAELAVFFQDTLDKYEEWLIFQQEWRKIRNQSMQSLTFPYDEYRKGQRELAVAAYKTILTERKLFVEAPTGTGKTISTMFPAVKAMGEEQFERFFYLTAKTITRQVAEDAAEALARRGMRMKSVTLTAKDKICFMDERICTPDYCPYANGYYDRLNEGLWDLLHHEDQFTRPIIETYARKHQLCPFELSLDVSLWCDAIVGDYNYLFDPTVYLRRFFEEENKENVFLIDEVHNLVDRSRNMYSASLNKSLFLQIKKVMKDYPKITRSLNKINQVFLQMRDVLAEKDFIRQKEPVTSLVDAVYRFTEKAKEWLAEYPEAPQQEEMLGLYFECLNYVKISELYDDHYVTYIEKTSYDLIIKQFCIDPSYLLAQSLNKGKAAILFSASLSPISYYQDILGGGAEALGYRLSSPFPPEHQLVLVEGIKTTYHYRQQNIPQIVASLEALVTAKKGNYLFFFPSYRFMDEVYEVFSAQSDARILLQDTKMNEEERENFLAQFQAEPTETTIGFCVLGGIFSEGIDLRGTRLIGTAIVSVGLPQISEEQNLIKEYYDESRQGFQYAYQIPGMNKVLQAAGRVIRDTQDQGVVLLLDERFLSPNYRQYLPPHWQLQPVKGAAEIQQQARHFWQHNS